jgi:hypothetical protein
MMSDMRGVIEVNGVQGFKHFFDDEWRAAGRNRPFDI